MVTQQEVFEKPQKCHVRLVTFLFCKCPRSNSSLISFLAEGSVFVGESENGGLL